MSLALPGEGTSPSHTLPGPPHCGLIAMWYGSLHSVTPAPQFLDQSLLCKFTSCKLLR